MAHRHVTDRLEREFGRRFSKNTIDSYVDQAFIELADHCAVETWIPVLAERYVRQQLTALAKVEGDDGLPAVLFVDTHDAGRSQLARALFERHAAGRAHAWSGGFVPATTIDPRVAGTLADLGIDLANEFPKPVTREIIDGADIVVLFGEIPVALPLGKRVERWPTPRLEDLAAEDAVAEMRDRIDERAARLAGESLG